AYIRCKHLTKTPAQIRRRKSPIWQWGEDIVAKDQPTSDRLFYCYLCEKKGAYQELMKIADGLQALNWQRNWDAWKLIFIRWIVYCYITFYQ
ncbi:hypothetical protein K469DRAFT_708544, partial [Zopfia rhizophila CBS 207.26]